MLQLLNNFRSNILKPVTFIGTLVSKQNLKKIADQLYDPAQSDELKAFSAAFGIFIGILPIWGLQTISAIFLSLVFKLNKVLVIIGSQVSFPLFFPAIIYLSYKTGSFWVSNGPAAGRTQSNLSFQNIDKHLSQYIYGSITLAVVSAIVIGLCTFMFLKLAKAIKQYRLNSQDKAYHTEKPNSEILAGA
jgi:uncharacterized protein (DUF2062 family)